MVPSISVIFGEVNSPRSPRYHKPGCPKASLGVEDTNLQENHHDSRT